MSSLADIPALPAAAEALDSWDWMERILAAHERQPTVYEHFVYHEGGCGAPEGERCTCGLMAAFYDGRHLVVVNPDLQCWNYFVH